jgi:hypothetical protein
MSVQDYTKARTKEKPAPWGAVSLLTDAVSVAAPVRRR